MKISNCEGQIMYNITQEMKNKIQEMEKGEIETMVLFEKSHS